MIMNRSRYSGGFTLVELLLAITLLSMLLGLAYGGLRAATRATDRGQIILEDSSRIRMGHQFVRKQLNQMLPLAFVDEGEGADRFRTVFEGESDYIRYVAPMPGYLGFGGPHVQELTFIPGDDDDLLLVLSHALLQGFEEDKLYARDPIILIDGIDSAAFEFQERDEEGESLLWTNRWEDPSQLPVAVSLNIEFVEGRYVKWPMLSAAVRVDGRAVQALAGENLSKSYNTTIQDLINKRKESN
jgi:general secretion pathway protein J